ncbi:Hypothetical protein NTJ_12325 [Nesidiocoris tenuis]|uniref:Uncharacterized protein n=1 Tax=Nesidiocoris tenuis TaxID=355587 RepID=A0ABN7B527_9HEMI|nr:Hypothetical protein NTJ_12325 [Nesidiocoris tenuis]
METEDVGKLLPIEGDCREHPPETNESDHKIKSSTNEKKYRCAECSYASSQRSIILLTKVSLRKRRIMTMELEAEVKLEPVDLWLSNWLPGDDQNVQNVEILPFIKQEEENDLVPDPLAPIKMEDSEPQEEMETDYARNHLPIEGECLEPPPETIESDLRIKSSTNEKKYDIGAGIVPRLVIKNDASSMPSNDEPPWYPAPTTFPDLVSLQKRRIVTMELEAEVKLEPVDLWLSDWQPGDDQNEHDVKILPASIKQEEENDRVPDPLSPIKMDDSETQEKMKAEDAGNHLPIEGDFQGHPPEKTEDDFLHNDSDSQLGSGLIINSYTDEKPFKFNSGKEFTKMELESELWLADWKPGDEQSVHDVEILPASIKQEEENNRVPDPLSLKKIDDTESQDEMKTEDAGKSPWRIEGLADARRRIGGLRTSEAWREGGRSFGI